MKQRYSMTKRLALVCSAIAVILIIAVAPYFITTRGPSSFCLREMRISDSNEKIGNASRYIRELQSSGIYPREITMTPTERVDKGGGDTPILGWSDYMSGGFSHYVHFRKVDPRHTEKERAQTGDNSIVLVDNCGQAVTKGVN